MSINMFKKLIKKIKLIFEEINLYSEAIEALKIDTQNKL